MERAHSSGTLQSPSTFSSGSKSGSSYSSHSAEKEKDLDLTKDNAASPIDLECHIQAERITKILDQAIFKTKLALCLPMLVQEYKTLHATLSSQHIDDLLFIFEQYENPLFSTSLLNMSAMEDIKAGDMSLKNRLNPELGHLLYIMSSYPVLGVKVEKMVEEMRLEYRQGDTKPNNLNLEYLLALEQFRELMAVQMTTSAAEELGAKFNSRKLAASNANYIAKIKEYTTALKEEQDHFEQSMATKSQMITKLEHELALLKVDANVRLKKKILDSERQMVVASRSHKVKYDILKEEEVEIKEAYENLLNQNILEEKNQRARKFKVETQLLSWLQKYDSEMAERQEELDDLEMKHKEEVKKSEECQEKLAEQDKEHIPLMAEREAEYQQEMMEKMTKFLHEHAARVIQNAWREVLANRAEKKKLRKLVKKHLEDRSAVTKRSEGEAASTAAAAKKAKKGENKEEAQLRKLIKHRRVEVVESAPVPSDAKKKKDGESTPRSSVQQEGSVPEEKF